MESNQFNLVENKKDKEKLQKTYTISYKSEVIKRKTIVVISLFLNPLYVI